MIESLFKNLPPDSLKYLVISQAVLLGVFIVQKFIDYFFVGFKSAKIRERKRLEAKEFALDSKLKHIEDNLQKLTLSVERVAGQVNLWTELFKLPQVQERMSGIAAKLRTDP